MIVLHSYSIAVLFCVITMICWGSWANTQKLASRTWSFRLFYWDFALGILLISFIIGITMGSYGNEGRPFFADLALASSHSLLDAFLGGVIFNIANILLVTAIDIAGMAVAFPIAIGLALVIGVIVNYLYVPIGNPIILFFGVLCVTLAIILDAIAYKKAATGKTEHIKKGIIIALICGVLMGFFYRFVIASMASNFSHPAIGHLTPYSAGFIFALGIVISNFLFNGWMIKRPIIGKPLAFSDYFTKGNLRLHSIGLLGGVIWGIGSTLNFIASGLAGSAISYGLGQGATMIAALWGVFIWREFAKAPIGTHKLILLMFLFYIIGLFAIIFARII